MSMSGGTAIERLRGLALVLTAVGGATLVVGCAIDLAHGDLGGVAWKLTGPFPFMAAGLLLTIRRPGWPVGIWLLAAGTSFMVSVTVGDALLPALAAWSGAWLLGLARDLAGTASVLAGLGLIGLFPIGRPRRPVERRIMRAVAVSAVAVPLLVAVTRPTFTGGTFPDPNIPVVLSPLYIPATAPAATAATAALTGFPALVVLGLAMLYLRHRREPDIRRRIRWLLIGLTAGLASWVAMVMVTWLLAPELAANVATFLWPVSLLFELGSILVASTDNGAMGIDRPGRRALVYRSLWALIALGYVASAAVLGVLASRVLPIGAAILLVAAAALLFQPLQRRLERLADRWAFGARLDSYGVLSRFGALLESAPDPHELLSTLAEAARQGLGLSWVRVRLDLPTIASSAVITMATAQPVSVPVDQRPELVVPLTYAGRTLGRIECGPRTDRLLIEEDRRLLAQLATQASVAVHERYLSIELAARLAVIERQAAELAASRARVAQVQDLERRRIQRDLHDGVQQEVVALVAKLATLRQRLRRGQCDGDGPLGELQADLHRHLSQLREFAHTIHPPVLADRGLLEAVEAQASRLPIAVAIEADPATRGVRYPPSLEAAAWYLIAEALTNVVKHANAEHVVIAVTEHGGRLAVEVRDDGCGFDPAGPRGLGLASLADRMDIVGGKLRVCSSPGAGACVRAEIPLSTMGQMADA